MKHVQKIVGHFKLHSFRVGVIVFVADIIKKS